MVGVLTALKKLSSAEPDFDDFRPFKEEVKRQKNDRGAALLLAANIENALDVVLFRVLNPATKDEMFDQRGPLGTFSSKILMGQALGLFGSETSRNLTNIRHIRNAFAHSKKPITFKTREVKAACDLIVTQEVVYPRTVPKKSERPDRLMGRKRYQRACEVIAHNLIWHSLHLLDHKGISRGALRPEIRLDERLELRLMPKPLP